MSMWHGLQVTKKLFRFAAYIFLISFVTSDISWAQFSKASFWSRRAFSIRFTTSSQSILSGNCSGTATIQTFTPQGAVYNVPLDTVVSFNAPVTTNFFSDSTCTTAISNLTITAGTSSRSFFFTDDSVGTITLAAEAIGFKTATQTETISANPFVWTGGANPDTSWSTAANWSGGVAPGSSDRALFNGICAINCSPTISSSINVRGVRLAATYAGTITQAAGQTISIQTNGWTQLAGTFVGSNATIGINGPFGLSGGTYSSTSTNLTVNKDFKIGNSPTFNANGGTYVIGNGTKSVWPGSIVFNNVTLSGGPYDYTTIYGTMNVTGNLATGNSDNRSALNGGAIHLSGDLKFDNHGFTGTTAIKLVGAVTQNMAVTGGPANVPSLEIASTGGTVNIANSINVFGHFTYTSGTVVVASGTTISFTSYDFGRTITPGPINFYNVAFSNGAYDYITLVGTMNVTNDLSFNAGDSRTSLNGGTIVVGRNIISNTTQNVGSVVVRLAGAGNQTVSGTNGNLLPGLEIASTGGTVTFANSFVIGGGFLYTSGTVNMGTTTQTFSSSGSFSSGPVQFYNLTFANGPFDYMSVNGTVRISNDLTFSAYDNRSSLNNGTAGLLSVGGNMRATTTFNNGNVPVEFVGSGIQRISSVGGRLPSGSRTVNSASSILTLESNINFDVGSQTLTVTAGAVNMAGYNLSVGSLVLNSNVVTKNGGTLTVNGSTVGTGALYGGTVNP